MAKILPVFNGAPFIFQVASQLGELTVCAEAHSMAEDRAKELKDQARAAWKAMSERVLGDIDKGDLNEQDSCSLYASKKCYPFPCLPHSETTT